MDIRSKSCQGKERFKIEKTEKKKINVEKTKEEKAEMEKLISVRNLTFSRYSEDEKEQHIILKDINLDINKGEFIAILGKNGSGKSTLAKHFNGILLPDEGEILVEGISTKNEDKLCDIRQKIGMVFQNPDNQIVSSVVEEDVAFGPENLGLPTEEIIKKVEKSLKAVEMYDFRKSSLDMLSGGQKQRVAIAGVLAMEPCCIILDEPTSMLDPKGRKDVLNTLLKLNKDNGTTIVLITHNTEELIYADRIIAMESGSIFLDGVLKDILSNKAYSKTLGLDSSQCLDLIYRLKEKGINLPETLDEGECVNNLFKLVKEGK